MGEKPINQMTDGEVVLDLGAFWRRSGMNIATLAVVSMATPDSPFVGRIVLDIIRRARMEGRRELILLSVEY